MTQINRFLFRIYNLIKKSRRNNFEIQKLLNEEIKINKF